MSRKMSSWRSFLFHQRFGYLPVVLDNKTFVEAPPRRVLRPTRPMTTDRRLELYTRDLTYKTADGIFRLTPAQHKRAQKKFNQHERPEGEGSCSNLA
jgi:hypothetical protein